MALPLSRLAGDWKAQPSTFLSPPSGVTRTVEANPNRLAIGFSYFRNRTISVIPQAGGDSDFGFFITGPDTEWYWWQKHGPIVGLPWVASGLAGAGDSIDVLEIIQTNTGG